MLSRPFIALMIAIFVATLGISMVSPLLPVYAKELGASKALLGLAFSSFALVQAFAGPIIGRLSDSYPRKPFIIGGLLVYVIAAIGYLTADSIWQVIAFRAFSGFGTSAIFSVAQAYIGDMTPPGHEGRWLGVYTTADIIGFGTGPVVAGVLRDQVGFEAVFVAMAVLLAIAALIVLWWLPARAPRRSGARREKAVKVSFANALRQRLVIALVLQTALTSLGFGASFSFLALRIEDDIGASPTLVGLAFSAQDLTAGVVQPFFGVLADRRDRRTQVFLGLMFQALFIAIMGVAGVYWIFLMLMLGMGASGSLLNGAAGAIRVVAGRRVGMGTLLGLNSMANGAGIVVGSIVGGQFADHWGTPAAFYFAAAVIAAGTAVFLALSAGLRVNEEPEAVLVDSDRATAAAG